MKLFISADIEGCAGVALAYETHKNEACLLYTSDAADEL